MGSCTLSAVHLSGFCKDKTIPFKIVSSLQHFSFACRNALKLFLDVAWLNLLKRTSKILLKYQAQVWVVRYTCHHLYCRSWSPKFPHCIMSIGIVLWKYAHFSISKRLWLTKPYIIIVHLVLCLISMPDNEVSGPATWQPLITHLFMLYSTRTTQCTWMKSKRSWSPNAAYVYPSPRSHTPSPECGVQRNPSHVEQQNVMRGFKLSGS